MHDAHVRRAELRQLIHRRDRLREAGRRADRFHTGANVLAPGDQAQVLQLLQRLPDAVAAGLLVTQSACESALGESVSGEGVVGFARAFLAAGAKAVNASLWVVNDSAATIQMSRFYGAIADGSMTTAAAWKKVRQEFVTSPPKEGQSHPFYWAAFVLYGDPL